MNYANLAQKIRERGKQRAWRHTTCEGGMGSYRSVDYIDLPRAVQVMPNTWAYFADQKTIAVQYHRTQIVHLHENGDVELNCSATSISTKARYRELGVDVWTERGESYASLLLFKDSGRQVSIFFPVVAGVILATAQAISEEQAQRVYSLWLGARTGDVEASDALAKEFRSAGLDSLARVVRDLRGTPWGRRQRAAKQEWEALAVAESDRWLAHPETGALERPITTRDILLYGWNADASAIVHDGKTWDVVNAFNYVGG